jgi:hypothetical protein
MHRIQVQITEAQERALREMARLRGESISALIREGVDRLIEPLTDKREAARKRALALIGLVGPGQPSDLAERHDDYLADAIETSKREL